MKKFVSIVLVLSMLVLLVGCGAAGSVQSAPSQATSGVEAGHYPVTLIDQAGREVVIAQKPQRLISSYYITTSLLMALEQDEYLVGVEDNAGLRPVYGLSSPELLELPSIGTAKELDLEACAALMPDLAVLPMKVKDSVEDLEALGIPVLLVNPESQQLLLEMIRLVAQATDTEATADALIGFIAEQEAYLNETLPGWKSPASIWRAIPISSPRRATPCISRT